MTYIVTALRCEAEPIIKYFRLKKDTKSAQFEIFSNDRIRLIISGVSKTASAIAATYLLTQKDSQENSVILNIGICGSHDRNLRIGTLCYINKITDHGRRKNYFPDIFLKHNLPEYPVETHERGVRWRQGSKDYALLVDMEASGFFAAASKFLPVHRIIVLKIVSDYLDYDVLSEECTKSLIEKNLKKIEKIISMSSVLTGNSPLISPEENKLIQQIRKNLRLTDSQYGQFVEILKKYKICTGKNLNIPDEFLSVKSDSKIQRNKEFERIRKYFD
jgi:nucleoside phosphorylase